MFEEQAEEPPKAKIDKSLVPERPDSPCPSGVSMKSDRSKDFPPTFSDGESGSLVPERPDSPCPSGVSMKSDRSKDFPPSFSDGESGSLVPERPDSPCPSGVSMKSDRSKDFPPSFSDGESGSLVPERPDSPCPSGVSMKSDRSKDFPPSFSDGESGSLVPERPDSPCPSGVSMKSDRSKDFPPSFSDGESGPHVPNRSDSPSPSESSFICERSKDDPPNLNEGGVRSDSPSPSDISTSSDHSNDDPIDFDKSGASSSGNSDRNKKRSETPQQQLISIIKKQFKNTLQNLEDNHPNKNNTEHVMRDDKRPEKFTEIKRKDIFKETQGQTIRTVLTLGETGTGKSHHVQKFIKEWATNADKSVSKWIQSLLSTTEHDNGVIFLLDISELHSLKGRKLSLIELLHHFYPEMKECKISNFEQLKVLFVLDGLDALQTVLDFDNNVPLADVWESTSVNVLLTNLIKGSLLPSARIWITSQPSAANQLPDTCVHRRTEIRYKGLKHKLITELKNRILSQHERKLGELQTDTELHEIHETEDREEKIHIWKASFPGSNKKRGQTVLTKGVARVGKTYQTQKYMVDWAKGRSSKNIDFVVPFDFSELNSRGEKVQNMNDLLHHFLNPNKHPGVCNYDECKILFVLDGLEKCKLPLDFANNKDLTDMEETASMDVLLTNLLKRKLLPSAHIWIVSRPSAADKIPSEYIQRVTGCRDKPDLSSQWELKSQLKNQFTHVTMGMDMQKTSALLNDIYTDLYIIEGERGEVNTQHEARQIEGAKFKPQETSIRYDTIFQPAEGKPHIKSVLTTGMAGIGKSFATMKYMLDWAEDKSHTDIFFMFPLSFRELNLRKDETHSLQELLYSFFPEMKTSEIEDYDKYKILIVLDGLDECRLDLVFSETEKCKDVKTKTSVRVLLTNLIEGNLLSKAQVWITSRPAASNSIPAGKVDRVTEVRGFNDDQKEEYFRKRFDDEDLAEKILSHVKNSRTLYIMCHIPVFCWLTSTVLEDFVKRKEEGKMPSTLTDMYIHFVLLQCKQANAKYGTDETSETSENSETDSCWNTRNKTTVVSLGKLAFEGLETGDLVFTEETLTDCGVNIPEATVFSGILTQIKRESHGLHQQKLFCFVHLSIQEFMAAFYALHTFSDQNLNLLSKPPSTDIDMPASDFYRTAVDKALGSKNGDWDLFLRFLLGLSLETNRNLLKELLKKTENDKETNEKTIGYIKEKLREENSDADQNFNLFHCLNELNDQSLVEEVKKYLKSETVTFENFSTSQWSALNFVLLTSDEKLDEFDLKKYRKSEKVLLGMLPVVKVAKTANLSWCELTEESCKGLLSSVLNSASSNLTELDMSHNDLLDTGVKYLAEGLSSLHCKLENLKLAGCQVTEEGCSYLTSALRSNKASTLKHLDLSYNNPGCNGKAMLSAIVDDPNMSLKTLSLDHCGEHRLKPGIKKYDGDLKFDENTASKRLVLSEGNKKVKTFKKLEEKAQRPENEVRFKRSQVFCEEGQTGLCYWEVEWKGTVGIAVAYGEVGRKWDSKCGLGCNDMSWSLLCSKDGYTAIHGKTSEHITDLFSQKIAVFLDWKAGSLTYYSDMSGKLSLIHTFHAKFTEPVYPSFWFKKGSVTLCEIDKTPLQWGEIERPKLTKNANAEVRKKPVPQDATGWL